jgi:hypothetical protein
MEVQNTYESPNARIFMEPIKKKKEKAVDR